MDVLPTFAVYGTGRITAENVAAANATWRQRVERLFVEAPIPSGGKTAATTRMGHVLAEHVAVARTDWRRVSQARDGPMIATSRVLTSPTVAHPRHPLHSS